MTETTAIHQNTDGTYRLPACPRCKGGHDSLTFTPFINGPMLGRFEEWATCPATGEPIVGKRQGLSAYVGKLPESMKYLALAS